MDPLFAEVMAFPFIYHQVLETLRIQYLEREKFIEDINELQNEYNLEYSEVFHCSKKDMDSLKKNDTYREKFELFKRLRYQYFNLYNSRADLNDYL